VFPAKVPQIITHGKVLVYCDADFKQFVEAMDCLGEKLGPLLFQFGYFNKKAFLGVNEFLARLRGAKPGPNVFVPYSNVG